MFTGLVESVGTVESIKGSGGYRAISVCSESISPFLKLGDSISINGACQTVTAVGAVTFDVEALTETLSKTNLGTLRRGSRVNLERPLTPAGRLDGHLVQGHVDGTATVSQIRRKGEGWYVSVDLSRDLIRGCIVQGSIAIDGVSLTIAALGRSSVTINIIPTTWRETTLSDRRVGDRVNIEVDILGKYVFRFLETVSQPGGAETDTSRDPRAGLTLSQLERLGYTGDRR